MRYLLSSLLIGLFLLSGCGHGLNGPAADHGEFEPYFQRFEAYSREQGRDTANDAAITIEFGNLGDTSEVGRCDKGFDGRHITIDRAFWNTAVSYREVLILHELGHCLLNRTHNNAIADHWPVSVMTPELLDPGRYESEKSEYLIELFHSS